MPIEAGPQSLLVQVMRNQSNTSAKNEQAVEYAHVKIVLCLLRREGSTVAQQIDKADSNTAIDVEDQVILLRCGDRFDGDSVIEELACWEVLVDEILDKLNTQIRVVTGLNSMANPRN